MLNRRHALFMHIIKSVLRNIQIQLIRSLLIKTLC